MPSSAQWVLLAYRLPREPSTPRISVWRQLRRIGALQLSDGLVTLPLDNRTRERFEWLADEIEEADGEATVWIAQPATRAQERALIERMTVAVTAEYEEVIAAARSDTPRRRTVARLRRSLRAIRARDFFPAPVAEAARQAVEELAEAVEVAG